MTKHLALFDIDKTIYDGFTIFPLAEYQVKHNLVNQKCVDILYHDLTLYKDGSVSYEKTVANLCFHWADELKGISYSQVINNSEDFFKSDNKFYTYFAKIIPNLSKTHDVYLITGEPQFIAKSIADKFGVTGYISAEFEVIHDVITGKVNKSLAKRIEKKKAIQHILATYGKKDSFAFGDSEGDIKMLKAVQYPICVNASSGLQKVATEKGWYSKKSGEVEELVMTLLNN